MTDPLWTDVLERDDGEAADHVEVRFVGRGPVARPDPGDLLEAIEPDPSGIPPEVAWAKQIHSAHVLEAPHVLGAQSGGCGGEWGEGDALVTTHTGLALTVITADCVPILLASREPGGPIAAVHAGWRGIASDIVAATVAKLRGVRQVPGTCSGSQLVAWIGPAIGPCCYEVGEDVADQVARAAGDDSVIRPNPDPPRPNPHLDLQEAVRLQLARQGVTTVQTVDRCTRCHPDELWSYRREGPKAGRNFGFLWIRDLSAVEG